MKAEGSEVTDAAGVLPINPSAQCTGRILDDDQVVFVCDGHDALHVCSAAKKMNGHYGFRARRNGCFK